MKQDQAKGKEYMERFLLGQVKRESNIQHQSFICRACLRSFLMVMC
jgi:hypothetical protein